MNNLKTAITVNSVWKFDLVLNRYIRFPRTEDTNQYADIPYTGEWDDFVKLERYKDSIIVYRPVPFGQGMLRRTSDIEWDDLGELDEYSEN